MNKVKKLIDEARAARTNYLSQLSGVSEEQAEWKPSPDEWNLVSITEHLFWAEQGGILGMWKTVHSIRQGTTNRVYESVHRDMPVEKIIELTWQAKEQVPAVAAPRLGGSLACWCAALRSLQEMLESFGKDLREDELRLQAQPHPISGPVDFQQRLEFIRFHLNRHQQQAAVLIAQVKQID